MEEKKLQSDAELEQVVGGYSSDGWVTVTGLHKGFLALRTAPTYDYYNEIKGSESYNGDKLKITGGSTVGSDGETYIWVYNPRTGRSGWTNARSLR